MVKDNLFGKTSYIAYLYPKALILTLKGVVMKVYRIGAFNSHCQCYCNKKDCYESIVQKCSTKKKIFQFHFVVLPYTIETFQTDSLNDLNEWLDAFSKIEECSSFKDELESKGFFKKSLQKIKFLESKKNSIEV